MKTNSLSFQRCFIITRRKWSRETPRLANDLKTHCLYGDTLCWVHGHGDMQNWLGRQSENSQMLSKPMRKKLKFHLHFWLNLFADRKKKCIPMLLAFILSKRVALGMLSLAKLSQLFYGTFYRSLEGAAAFGPFWPLSAWKRSWTLNNVEKGEKERL